MRLTKRGRAVICVSACTGAFIFGLTFPYAIYASAGDESWYPVAKWEMNEKKGATVLKDSANSFDGRIGKHVVTNGSYHYFSRVDQDTVRPAHIDRIPDNDTLDPAFGDFAVSVKFKWPKSNDRNLVQKGQGSPVGGIFKMKTTVPAQGEAEGYIKCLFRGSSGDSQVVSYGYPKLNDDQWHVVRCERTNNGTAMFVDGTFVDMNTTQPGSISNDWPIAIGGNSYCEDTPTQENQCNYWHGKIGFVRWFFN